MHDVDDKIREGAVADTFAQFLHEAGEEEGEEEGVAEKGVGGAGGSASGNGGA